jgi:hypothetical protein
MDNNAAPVANDNTNVQPAANDTATLQATPAPADNQQQNVTNTMLGGDKPQQQEPAPAGAPEAYDFTSTIPEGVEIDEALSKGFSDLARGMNLTNEQANQMAKFGFDFGQQVAQAVTAQYNAEVAQWGDAAKKELGADFDKVMATAGAGIEAVEKVVPNIRQALNETGAGNRIEIIRAMEMLGQLVQADPGKTINAGTPAVNQASETWYDHTTR